MSVINPMLDNETERAIQYEYNITNLQKLTLQVCDLLSQDVEIPEDETPEQKAERQKPLKDQMKKVMSGLRNHEEEAERRYLAYVAAENTKNTRLDQFTVPEVAEENSDYFSLKDVTQIAGKVDSNSCRQPGRMRAFISTLFQYGQTQAFSERQYKNALAVCLEGHLYEEYNHIRDKSLKDIIEWFDTVYHQPTDIAQLEAEMEKFVRRRNETVIVFFKRYDVLAEKTDALLPETQKYYSLPTHKLDLLIKVLQEPGKSEYIKWKNAMRKTCLPEDVEAHIKQAAYYEEYHNCLPTHDFSIHGDSPIKYGHKTRDVEAHTLTRSNAKSATSEDFKSIPYKGKRKSRTPSTPRSNIDPIKSTTDRPNFFLNRRSRSKSVDSPRSARNVTPKSNPIGFLRSRRPIIQPRRITFSPLPPSRSPHRNKFRGNPNRSIMKHHVRRVFSQPMGRRPKYCNRCGVKRGVDKTKVQGTHISRDCRFYKQYYPQMCPFCLQTKGLEAYHPLHLCRFKKVADQNTNRYRST